jgi:hypothetical protein
MQALPIQQIVDRLHSGGLSLSLTDTCGLKASPASAITPELRELIKAYKPELVAYLMTLEPPDVMEEPKGYEGTGWRLSNAGGLSAATLAKFRAASLRADAIANQLIKQQEENHA